MGHFLPITQLIYLHLPSPGLDSSYLSFFIILIKGREEVVPAMIFVTVNHNLTKGCGPRDLKGESFEHLSSLSCCPHAEEKVCYESFW